MRAEFYFILRLYALLTLGAIFLTIAMSLRFDSTDELAGAELTIPFFGLVELSIPLPKKLSRPRIIRTFLAIWGLVILGIAFAADLSTAFPQRMRITVFYDENGIRSALAQFTPDEQRELGIAAEWPAKQKEYDSYIRQSLAALWREYDSTYVSDTAFVSRRSMHANGETTFIIERLGFLYYRISESNGKLHQRIEALGTEVEPFWTFFTLRETSHCYLRVGLWEFLKTPEVMLRPEFKQVLSLDSRRQRSMTFDHVITGATKIYFVPFPSFKRTLYLWESPDGYAVPIGYSVYYPYR
jgi:hypothetical protein